MCVLCYEFAGDDDWTDAPVSRSGEPVPLPPGRRQRRLEVLNAVLAPYGLGASDPGQGRHLVVSDRKGRSEVVAGLAGLWPAVRELAPRCPDVLDETLLAALAVRWGTRVAE